MSFNVTALVPMKGNSERVPNKNMKDFNGKPLCHWIIQTLENANYVDEILVNTDSDIIKEYVSKSFKKVRTIDRPVEIQGDFVSMNEIIKYDMSCSKNNYFLQTHSTNPCLTAKSIDLGIKGSLIRIKTVYFLLHHCREGFLIKT